MSAPAPSSLVVGLFVLGGFALVISGVVMFGASRLFEARIPAETYLDESITGLSVGSSVKFRGVAIGEVDQISFVPSVYPVASDDPRYADAARLILVRLGLDPDKLRGPLPPDGDRRRVFARMIASGLRVRLASTGLTGVPYIEMSYLDPEAYPAREIWWEPAVQHIPSAASAITRLQASAEGVIEEIEEAEIAALITDADSLIREITSLVETVNLVLGDLRGPDGRARLATAVDDGLAMIANLRAATAGVRTVTDQVAAAAADDALAAGVADALAVIGSLRRVAGDVATASAELPALVERLGAAAASVEQVSGALAAVDRDAVGRIVRDASATAASLRGGVAGLPAAVERTNRTLRRVNEIVLTSQADIAIMLENLVEIASNLRQITANAAVYPSQIPFGAPPPPVTYPERD